MIHADSVYCLPYSVNKLSAMLNFNSIVTLSFHAVTTYKWLGLGIEIGIGVGPVSYNTLIDL